MTAHSRLKRGIWGLCVLAFIAVGVIVTTYATNVMSKKMLILLGTKARDIVTIAARHYHITDAEVEELKLLSFEEIYQHPANIRLQEMFTGVGREHEIRFAYIMTVLEEDKIKYAVTDEYAEFYGAETGRPLELMWLVDLVIGKTREEVIADDDKYYEDIKRYSYIRTSDSILYYNRETAYSLIEDEYGMVISGLAPIYSEEGTFVGMMGVDIYIEEYTAAIAQIRQILSINFILPSAILTLSFLIVFIGSIRQMRTEVYTDGLTTIKNRGYLNTFFPAIVSRHYRDRSPLAVIMIDIDHFKQYNDNYGHQEGDQVLVMISKAINATLRKADIVCRYGGEELFAILTNTGPFEAEIVAGRIKEAVKALAIKHEYNMISDIVTISQGVFSAVPAKSDSGSEFIECADKGLYKAKDSGRDKYVMVSLHNYTSGATAKAERQLVYR